MEHIRNWRPRDAAALAVSLNNKNVQNNLRDGIPFPYSKSDARVYIATVLTSPPGSVYAWAVTAGSKVVGSIGIFRKENIHRYTAELGYYLAEPYWGRGIMTAAVTEACAYVFEDTDIVRIFAEPFARNTASCRVLEKAGFSCEGLLRKNAFKNGEFLDMKLYALVKDRPE